MVVWNSAENDKDSAKNTNSNVKREKKKKEKITFYNACRGLIYQMCTGYTSVRLLQ